MSVAAVPGNSVAPLILSGKQSSRPEGTYSKGITEIIGMLDANLDTPVILAYIQNSQVPYNPDAAELLALKDHGASTDVLKALLHRGDELRLQIAQNLASTNSVTAPPSYDESLNTPYPTYPYGYPESDDVASPNTYYSLGWPGLPVPVYHRVRPIWSRDGGVHKGRSDPPPADEGAKTPTSVASFMGEQHANDFTSHASGARKPKGGRSR